MQESSTHAQHHRGQAEQDGSPTRLFCYLGRGRIALGYELRIYAVNPKSTARISKQRTMASKLRGEKMES